MRTSAAAGPAVEATVGVTLMSAPGQLAYIASAFEEAGVASLWVGEYFHSALVRASVVAGATNRVTVGTHVLQAFARSPLATALAAQDLQELASGRFVLGIGSQVPAANRKWHGVDTPRPVELLEEYVTALRALLDAPSDQTVRFTGATWSYRVPPFRPAGRHSPPPIHIGGAGARTVRAAARVADGLLGHLLWTSEHVRDVVRPVFGQRGPVTVARMAAPASVPGGEVDTARRLAHYAVTPAYQSVLADQGFELDRAELLAAVREGLDDRLVALTTGLRERFCVTGPEDLRTQLRAAGDAGVAAVLLFVPAGPGEEDQACRYELALCDLVGTVAAAADQFPPPCREKGRTDG